VADEIVKKQSEKLPIYGHVNFGEEQRSLKGLEKVTAPTDLPLWGIDAGNFSFYLVATRVFLVFLSLL
jgi:hypothetical protein